MRQRKTWLTGSSGIVSLPKAMKFPGCFHGFEAALPKLGIGKAAVDFTYGKYAEFYDRYVA